MRKCRGFGEYKGKCPNEAGDQNPFWCNRCDKLRIKHINKQLRGLAGDMGISVYTPGPYHFRCDDGMHAYLMNDKSESIVGVFALIIDFEEPDWALFRRNCEHILNCLNREYNISDEE